MALDNFRRRGERDTRVEDYLDDKLQAAADLDTLDLLLENVKNQQGLLRKQLEDAERDLQGARQAARDHSSSVRQKADQFRKEQGDIDRRLLIVTQSETSDEARPQFERIMDKLHRFDVATGYMELLKEVHALSESSQSQLKISDEAALEPYHRLQMLLSSLQPLQDAAEGAAPHVVDHVDQMVQKLRQEIQDSFSADLEKTLTKIYWPRAGATIPPTLQQEWSNNVGRLIELQRPELEAREDSAVVDKAAKEPLVLLPVEVLVRPLVTRFRYHFDGDRPTNRLDKPEYFLSHTIDLLDKYNGFFVDYCQPELLRHFRGSALAMNPVYIDATSALITGLLPMLRAKIFGLLPQVASQPQLLSHLIHEIMSFDTTVRDEWRYNGGYGVEGWKGLAWEVLVKKEWFARWLRVERDFALSRYQDIIDAPDSGTLDYDSVDPSATKPTKAAIRVNDLLETITDRYRPLSSFTQKLRFLIDVQLDIFDRFHTRLHQSLEAYLTMTSSLARTVHGISREEQASLQGVKGLDRLCRIFGSADYLEKAMRDWSDDVFFLDLYAELKDRARSTARAGGGKNLAGPMTVADVATRTSSSVVGDGDDDEGALFDETAAAYGRLRVRSEGVIIDVLSYNVREALRPYGRINPWASLSTTISTTLTPSSSSAADPSSTSTSQDTHADGTSANTSSRDREREALAVTAELDVTLSLLSTHLSFLVRALAPAPLRRIVRAVCATLQTWIWDHVLTRHAFSAQGARQLAADVAALCSVIDGVAGAELGRVGMARLAEGVQLLGLPVRASGSRGRVAGGAEDEAGAGVDASADRDAAAALESNGAIDGGDDDAGRPAAAPRRLGLWEVERRLFVDNESARAVLDELGVAALSEGDARAVLERRVELAS
ncbi:TIP-1 family-domain-containing protein [Cryomyces antarcticus]